MSESTNIFKLKAIQALEGYCFHVKNYQRGYKWSILQVSDLLDDIDNFDPNQDSIYCLQPLVVKQEKTNNKHYELIDGQQRMSTIYIILAYLSTKPTLYDIEYNTREESKDFLSQINQLPKLETDKANLNNIMACQPIFNQQWEEHIKDKNKQNNVDNYHFFIAYQTIHIWFSNKSDEEKDAFKEKLLAHVHIIWYETEESEISEKVFMKINSGKIPLTSSELIKALFLLDIHHSANPEIAILKQHELAREWDHIEYSLQNDTFWYFIADQKYIKQESNRINLLFNSFYDKSNIERDAFYAYREYAKSKESLDWQKVKVRFQQLNEWFSNRTLYHLIGFCIATNLTNMNTLLQLQEKSNTKSSFEQELRNLIKKEFQKQKEEVYIYDFEHLHYENSYDEVKIILLLFNIETYLRSDPNFRFPFDRYKKEQWSLEHIHPQKPREFTKKEEVLDWLEDAKEVSTADHLDLLKDMIKSVKDTSNDLLKDKRLKQELAKLASELPDETHGIDNLTLLDQQTNSSIGNKKFLKKRQAILAIDKEGKQGNDKSYIPICTKHVFLKYYTKSEKDIQMSFWGKQDRSDYENAIKHLLKPYLNIANS